MMKGSFVGFMASTSQTNPISISNNRNVKEANLDFSIIDDSLETASNMQCGDNCFHYSKLIKLYGHLIITIHVFFGIFCAKQWWGCNFMKSTTTSMHICHMKQTNVHASNGNKIPIKGLITYKENGISTLSKHVACDHVVEAKKWGAYV